MKCSLDLTALLGWTPVIIKRAMDTGDLMHRSDSIQGTDYIANYFFFNLRVSRTKIENPK